MSALALMYGQLEPRILCPPHQLLTASVGCATRPHNLLWQHALGPMAALCPWPAAKLPLPSLVPAPIDMFGLPALVAPLL